WFFRTFSGGWSFTALDGGRTQATWRYSFTCRPRALAVVAVPLGRWLLGRDIRRRLAGFARGCADPDLVAPVVAAGESATNWLPIAPGSPPVAGMPAWPPVPPLPTLPFSPAPGDAGDDLAARLLDQRRVLVSGPLDAEAANRAAAALLWLDRAGPEP